jgi:hypothetical protein
MIVKERTKMINVYKNLLGKADVEIKERRPRQRSSLNVYWSLV